MPLVLKKTVAQGTLLGIWKKEETYEFLQTIYPLRSEEKNDFEKINNILRKGEWLTTRILLTEMLEKRKTISYSEYGKPYIIDSQLNMSISHSKNFVAIIISSHHPVGIDIEHISERVRKVQHKFLNDEETLWCKTLKQQTLCWCAKEAIFKIYEKDLDFKNIVIKPFECESDRGMFNAVVLNTSPSNGFRIQYLEIEEDVLTYTMNM